MANATNYLEKKITDHVLGKASFTMPTPYLALFTANPGEAGSTASEISGGGYSRQAISAAMSAAGATDGKSANTGVINFGPASANWGGGSPITHAAVMDAATGGNMLVYIPLDTPQIINANGNLQFPVGELEIWTE